MEFKGTKGEWTIYMPDDSNGWAKVKIIGAIPHDSIHIHTGYFTDKKGDALKSEKARVLADAKLIAAAPDLLNSLIDLVEAGENGDLNCLEDFEDARKAINKALK